MEQHQTAAITVEAEAEEGMPNEDAVQPKTRRKKKTKKPFCERIRDRKAMGKDVVHYAVQNYNMLTSEAFAELTARELERVEEWMVDVHRVRNQKRKNKRKKARADKQQRKEKTSGQKIREIHARGKSAVDFAFAHRQNLTASDRACLTQVERRILKEKENRLAKRRALQEEETALFRQAQERRQEEQRRLAEEEERRILEAPDPTMAGARSHHSQEELRRMGFTKEQIARVSTFRRPGLRLTAAAEYLGIPKGRLDRWVKENVVQPSFHRRMHITGQGAVLARHFVPDELDAILKRIPEIERQSKALKKRTRS